MTEKCALNELSLFLHVTKCLAILNFYGLLMTQRALLDNV